MDTKKIVVSILGCGWYGLELAKELVKNGYPVKGSTTRTEKFALLRDSGIMPYLVQFDEKGEDFDAEFFKSEVLIICIPPKRSTAEQHTFLSKLERIATAAARQLIKHVIFISSTSVYGDRNIEVDENTDPQPDSDSGKAIRSAELLLKNTTGFDTTILRFGGLIGPGRDPGRFFAGKSDIPNGDAPVNLIHLQDCIGITMQIIDQHTYGDIINACSADHPDRASFYTAAALRSGLEKPTFRRELLSWKIVSSVLLEEKLKYRFKVKLNSLV